MPGMRFYVKAFKPNGISPFGAKRAEWKHFIINLEK